MSALRKQEPFPNAESANQRRAGIHPDTVDSTEIESADRRPPQSVPAPPSSVITDDTYDGEIVDSSTGPAIPNLDRRPVAEPTHAFQDEPSYAAAAPSAESRNNNLLFAEDELRDFRARWDQVQTSFVDEPHHAVEQANALIGTVMKRITERFSEEQAKLEKQRERGGNGSTEELRQGFKRYRAFFDRLLAL